MSDEEWESGEWRMKSGEWYGMDGMDGMVWYGMVLWTWIVSVRGWIDR